MKALIACVLGLCAAVFSPLASAGDVAADVLTGRVEALYVRLQPGVYRVAPANNRPAVVWAEVKTYDMPGYQSRGAVVMIRTDAAVERGDIVNFRGADESAVAPLPAESRILAVTAKRGTSVALMFGSATTDTGF